MIQLFHNRTGEVCLEKDGVRFLLPEGSWEYSNVRVSLQFSALYILAYFVSGFLVGAGMTYWWLQ